VAPRAEEILALDQALSRLGALSERMVKMVELRFFAGLSVEETAEVLGLDPRTVNRDWRAPALSSTASCPGRRRHDVAARPRSLAGHRAILAEALDSP